MKLPYLLIALLALVFQDARAEGKRWWSHVEFLASDALEGRNVATPGFDKAVAYVEGEFKKIEPDPANPRYLLTEPWVGYRFADQPD